MRNIVAMFIIAAMITLVFAGLTQPATEPPGYDPGIEIGVQPAQANWFYTCVPHRTKHFHPLREVIHVWKNVIQFRRGGRYYVRGTWASINMNSGNQFASDRRTYDCTGRG